MASFWIVHREPQVRSALARLAAAGEDSVLGGPSDPQFESVGAPDAVLLGLSGDLESELEFAHRFGPRLPGTAWLLLADPRDVDEAHRLFDALPAEVLRYPPAPGLVRRCLRASLAHRRADSLSERQTRDAVAARFSRYFADLEMPELLRALDPRLAAVPLLIRGEAGTGRGILARYVHAFGGTTGGAFLAFPCDDAPGTETVREAIRRASREPRARSALSICFEDVDRLPRRLQREFAEWIEFAPPAATLCTPRLRFMATAGDPEQDDPARDLEPRLSAALAGLTLRIPPLRRRAAAIPAFVEATARAWCDARGERTRSFGDEALACLSAQPWPENSRELEGVVTRTLSATSADPIRADHLRFELVPPAAPLELPPGALVEEEPEVVGELEVEPEAVEVEPEAVQPEPEAAAVPPSIETEALAPPETAAPPAEMEAVAPPARAEGPPPDEPLVAPAAAAPAPGLGPEDALRRLVGAVAHEVRNPLVAIRTFAQLLPERFEDPEFRTRFAESVKRDVARLEEVVSRLAALGSLPAAEGIAVDVAALLDELLEARREALQERRILVLKELDHSDPFAVADPTRLRIAAECVLDKALSLVPERGDAYVASRHHPSGLRGGPSVRVLMRFRTTDALGPREPVEGVSVEETSLDLLVAEALVQSQGGTFHLDASESGETLAVIDLPAPASAGA